MAMVSSLVQSFGRDRPGLNDPALELCNLSDACR